MLSTNNHRYLWPCHQMLGELPHAKGFLWMTSPPTSSSSFISKPLLSRQPCLLFTSSNFFCPFLFLFSPTSLIFFNFVLYLWNLKAQSNKERLGRKKRKRERSTSKTSSKYAHCVPVRYLRGMELPLLSIADIIKNVLLCFLAGLIRVFENLRGRL